MLEAETTAGPDGVPASLIKKLKEILADPITELGNKSNGLLKSINGLLKGLGDSLKGLEDSLKVNPVAVNPQRLYESGDLSRLRSEVESLKSDYEAELRSMKSYFNFTSGVSSGDFNSFYLKDTFL